MQKHRHSPQRPLPLVHEPEASGMGRHRQRHLRAQWVVIDEKLVCQWLLD